MRLLLRYVLPLLIALPLGFLLLYPQVVRCIRVGQSADFQALPGLEPGTRAYLSRLATARQQTQFRTQLLTARARIRHFWGSQRGEAILIYCPQQAVYEQYCVGGEGAGCSLGTPWGASYLILGPEGNNADVIAHELCHDELFARLGWWRVKRQIPQWFNEGLAMMVDYRFSSPAIWDLPAGNSRQEAGFETRERMPFAHRPMLKLADLETTRDFFGGSPTHVMLAYQTAADEVSRWLALVGRAGVLALTDSVAAGHNFGDIYRQLERKKRRAVGQK